MSKVRDILWEAVQGKEKQFTTGSIKKAIVLLSIPMILEMAMESLFAVVDVFFVSRVGVDAVTTVGLTESVITIVYSLAWGISMAATAMVSRRIGEEKPEEAAKSAVQAILLALALGVALGIAGFVFAGDILRLMGAKASVRSPSKVTMRLTREWRPEGRVTTSSPVRMRPLGICPA